MQTFFDDSDEDVSTNCDPYLRLYCIFAGAQKGFDTQMLLDPFEEQFDLPALLVKCRDHLWFECKVVGQKSEPFSGLVLDNDAAQGCGIILARSDQWQDTSLIADDIAGGSIDRVRVAPFELGIAFCPCDEEGVHRMQPIQSCEIEIAAIHQVIRTWFDHQIVEQIDFVGLAVGDVNEAGNGSAQVEQRMQFDGCFGGSKRCPRIHRQTQIDSGGIEGIHRRIEIDAKRFAGIQRARHRNQVLRKIGVDLPGSRRVRIGQRIAGNRRTAKSHVVQPMGLGAQIDFDIAQRFPISQLCECHGEELIQTRKILDLVFASMSSDTSSEGGQRQIRHDLRKNEFALMHGSLQRISAKSPNSAPRRSNRDQTKTSIYANESLTYERQM